MENAAHADRPVGRPREAAGLAGLAAFENNVFRRGPVNADDYEMVTGKKGTTSFGEIRDAQIVQETVCAKSENKTVFESMLGARDCVSLDYYKKEISSAVNPKWETPINLSRGHKAIAQFKKGAPDDHVSRLDLMMHFVEQTAAQTLECMHQDRR